MHSLMSQSSWPLEMVPRSYIESASTARRSLSCVAHHFLFLFIILDGIQTEHPLCLMWQLVGVISKGITLYVSYHWRTVTNLTLINIGYLWHLVWEERGQVKTSQGCQDSCSIIETGSIRWPSAWNSTQRTGCPLYWYFIPWSGHWMVGRYWSGKYPHTFDAGKV